MEEGRRVIKGYKGFDKDLRCRGFQYEVGKEYECEKAILCEEGFHFCENPLEVLRFYPPYILSGATRYCEVEGSGEFDDYDMDKICCTKIKIVREITLQQLIEAGKQKSASVCEDETGNAMLLAKYESYSNASTSRIYSMAVNSGENSVASNTGYYSAAINIGRRSVSAGTYCGTVSTNEGVSSAAVSTGNNTISGNKGKCSVSANTGMSSYAFSEGDRSLAGTIGVNSSAFSEGEDSAAVSVGYGSSASASGKESVAVVTGKDCIAKGALGCWIVLTERGELNSDCYPIKEVKAFKVDGETIKPDTYYKLVNGEAVEVTD